MRRCGIFVIVLLTSLLLFACSREEEFSRVSTVKEPSMQSSEYDIFTTETDAISNTSFSSGAGMAQNSSWSGYVGYSDNKKNYQFLYGDDRDRRWEEVVVQFADSYLSPSDGHPFLSDREVDYQVLDEDYKLSDLE